MHTISYAETPEDIVRCFPILQQLRPHLAEKDFVRRIKQLRAQGYRLIYLQIDGEIRAVAGFQIMECLAWDKFLYVYDLVTHGHWQASGYGSALFQWLVDHARTHACDQLHLDSGVQRFGAHRFYLGRGMDITSHHFALELRPGGTPSPDQGLG